MNRRRFLKALGASAVVLQILPSAKTETDEERFLRLLETGYVSDETFHFSGPVIVAKDNFVITRCKFFFPELSVDEPAITFTGSRGVITHNHITVGTFLV